LQFRKRPPDAQVKGVSTGLPERARLPWFPAASLTHVLLLAILALGAFLRLHQLHSLPPALSVDESMNGCNAPENIEKGRLRVFYPENFGRDGLFINLQTLSVYLLGNGSFALRLPSAAIGIMTVSGLYLLGKVLFETQAGANWDICLYS
jgi:hypothetical protein